MTRVAVSRRTGLFVLVVVLVTTAGLALDTEAVSAESTVTAKAGVGGRYVPGRELPVTVTVQADRLIRGTLRVTPDGNTQMTVEVPVEVSAGSGKDIVAILPSVRPNGGPPSEVSVSVDLIEEDAVVASTAARATFEEWTEVVGVLPQLASQTRLTDTAALRFGGGIAKLATVDRSLLDAGAGALGPFATVVGSPGELAALSGPQRHAVLQWLAAGGQLYIDGEAGTYGGLPEEWQPVSGWAPAESGVVRVSHGLAQAARWSSFLDATSAGRGFNASQRFYNPDDQITTLSRDAGFQVPQLGFLLGLLVLYVLLIGPVNFIVLSRMRRRTLAWATVPALSVLFTGGFVVGGAQARTNIEGAHATVIEVGPLGATAHGVALIGSGDGGRATVHMPAGWAAERDTTDGRFSNSGQPATNAQVTPVAGGTVAHLDSLPGQFLIVRTGGPIPGFDDALQVRAGTDGHSVTGVVVNNLDVALQEVTVLVNNTTTPIGTIDAHGRLPFSVTGPLLDANPRQPNTDVPEVDYWPTDEHGNRVFTSVGGPFTGTTNCNPCPPTVPTPPAPRTVPDNVVNAPFWTSLARAKRIPTRVLGEVVAVGWTRTMPSPMTVEGATPLVKGRTGFVAHGDIAADRLDTIGVRFEQLRDTDLRHLPDPAPVDSFVLGSLFRMVLPTTVAGQPIDPSQLVLEAPADLHRFAIASAAGWRVSPEQSSPLTYHLTAADVIDGAIYVRVRLPDEINQAPVNRAGPYLGWKLRGATPGEPGGVVVTDPATLPLPSAPRATP
jgi:hypothetical protein